MKADTTKRSFLGGLAATFGILGSAGCSRGNAASPTERFEVMKTPAEWKRQLGPARYAVLREANTERAGSSPLDREKRKGAFVCAGCALPLYSSAAKYDSGTGWPSFFKPLPNAIRTKPERTFFGTQTEVHCRRCGGHLGHVFDDGPAPTGKRYCMNGLALHFVPA